MKNIKECSDDQLVELYREENRKDAFGEIYNRYVDHVFRFIYSKVGRKDATEEIVSETFLVLINILDAYNGDSKLSTFIFGVALNKARSYFYQQAKRKEVILDDEITEILSAKFDSYEEYESESNELIEVLDEVLKQLPENYQKILEVRFINSRSMKETSEELNISEENVRVLQYRALKKAKGIANKLLNIANE